MRSIASIGSAVALLIWFTPSSPVLAVAANAMALHFIDVGQAHSTLVEFPCGAMLVDAGSQDDQHADALTGYLEAFFARRSDLNRTLGVVLITHNHKDHTFALGRIADRFRIITFVDNGFTTGSGSPQTNALRKNAVSKGIHVRPVLDKEVERAQGRRGLSDDRIDPFKCATVDPMVRVLSGRFDYHPDGWSEEDLGNQNNHSLVTRIDFGRSSALFMGDLEVAGIDLLLNFYTGDRADMLDADVIQVGHHGSHNATTQELLDAVSPTVAVIPVGKWTFGRTGGTFTTFAFGHPRETVVDLLSQHIGRTRAPSKPVMTAERAKSFHRRNVTKAVYATGWDGTLRVAADAAGKLTVFRDR